MYTKDKSKILVVRVDARLHAAVRDFAMAHKMSVSDAIRIMLRSWIAMGGSVK